MTTSGDSSGRDDCGLVDLLLCGKESGITEIARYARVSLSVPFLAVGTSTSAVWASSVHHGLVNGEKKLN